MESLDRTISVSGRLELLQMVLEPDRERCVSEDAMLQRGWTPGGVPVRTLSPEGGRHRAMCQQRC